MNERMKNYEAESEKRIKINTDEAFLVRLDGRCFSNKTSHLIKPFDINFANAMLKTCGDLLKEFHCATAYTQSDEITLVFNKRTDVPPYIFGNKVTEKNVPDTPPSVVPLVMLFAFEFYSCSVKTLSTLSCLRDLQMTEFDDTLKWIPELITKFYDLNTMDVTKTTLIDLLIHSGISDVVDFLLTNQYTHQQMKDKLMIIKKQYITETQSQHIFGGKVRKILSVLAGYTSTRFTINFLNELKESLLGDNMEYKSNHEKYIEKLDGGLKDSMSNVSFCFDARIIVIPNSEPELAAEILMWRSVYDGYRNFVAGVSRNVFSKKGLNNISTRDRVTMLEEKGINVNDMPYHMKYGWYVKLLRKEIETEHGSVIRGIPYARSFKIDNGQIYKDLVYSKYWLADNPIIFNEERNLY